MDEIHSEAVAAGPDLTDIALFFFIPFCKIRCTYCDFNAYANLSRLMEPYCDALAQEVRIEGDRHSGRRARSVYLGGGTPSLLTAAQLTSVMEACGQAFALASDAEITLEANPGTLDQDKLQLLLRAGVNRLSLGVQSFDDAALRRLNRGHTVADVVDSYRLAREAGFANINLDLIYGLPLQSLADWETTLERALEMRPEHLSLYALKVEADTGLEYQIRRGKYLMPDDDLAADMYEMAEAMLDAAGYEHYEISNWARRDRRQWQSHHNSTYWLNEWYLGFGAGAHSYFGGTRYWNVLAPQEYIARVERGESVVAGREEIDRELEMAEGMFLGLRLCEGVSFAAFSRRYGQDVRDRYRIQLKELEELQLIESSDIRVRLTPRGRLLSNEVFWRFLP
ncbi:MAG: radical SAM family heme chaperone HemW [Chloroflexi bacterium]|nr:radical SAM family heme chaperone HemW [Chloroflexota bacterium]